jgi:hypothetical protein
MRLRSLAVSFFAVVFALLGQSDRGTISDPAGAVVANAPIEALNVVAVLSNRTGLNLTKGV